MEPATTSTHTTTRRDGGPVQIGRRRPQRRSPLAVRSDEPAMPTGRACEALSTTGDCRRKRDERSGRGERRRCRGRARDRGARGRVRLALPHWPRTRDDDADRRGIRRGAGPSMRTSGFHAHCAPPAVEVLPSTTRATARPGGSSRAARRPRPRRTYGPGIAVPGVLLALPTDELHDGSQTAPMSVSSSSACRVPCAAESSVTSTAIASSS
jgi:hypothetical protein